MLCLLSPRWPRILFGFRFLQSGIALFGIFHSINFISLRDEIEVVCLVVGLVCGSVKSGLAFYLCFSYSQSGIAFLGISFSKTNRERWVRLLGSS